MPDRYSPRLKRALTALVISVPAVLLMLTAEVYLRLTTPYDDLWALTGRRGSSNAVAQWALLDAFSGLRGKPGTYHSGSVTKTVNREGFISTPELSVAKPPNTIRIAFLGESSTAGTGTLLPDSLTWPWQVSELLRRRPGRGSRLEFINAALGGFTTFESLGRLANRVRFFSPDIVVVYHGWNELQYFDQVDQISRWRTGPDGSWGLQGAERVTVYEPRWFDWMLRPSQLLTKARLRLSQPVSGEVPAGALRTTLAKMYDRRGLEIFRTNLRLIRAVAQSLGMELFVGKQATLVTADLPEREQRRCNYALHGFDHPAHVDAFRELYRVIDAEVPADHVIDLTPLSGIPENFYDHIHPTPLGARRTAALVAAALAAAVDALERRLSPLEPGDSSSPTGPHDSRR